MPSSVVVVGIGSVLFVTGEISEEELARGSSEGGKGGVVESVGE